MKKLAVIGCGGIGGYHLEHLVEYKDVELVGFCDVIKEKADGFVRKAGRGASFGNFMQLFDETKPDMVFIGIPPYCHGEIEFEAARRGIHMFIEKPVALDMGQARRISDAITKSRVITAVGFQCRYDNINAQVKDYIKNNKIVSAACTRVGGIIETDWFRNRKYSGGQLVEQTIHQIDMLRYFLGEADSVYSVAGSGIIPEAEYPGSNVDDLSTSIINFKSGVSCTVMTGLYSLNGASWDSKITLGCRESRLDYYLTSKVIVYGIDEADIAPEIKGIIKGDGVQAKSENETGLRYDNNVDFGVKCDRTFVDAVISGDPSAILSPYSDAVKTLEIVLACNKSMETGLPVKL